MGDHGVSAFHDETEGSGGLSDWRWALASAIGTSHLRTLSPCQDASVCELVPTRRGTALVAVVADGAGSAKRAEVGSRLACEVAHREIASLFASGGGIEDVDHSFGRGLIQRIQEEVGVRADAEGLACRDFACTFLCSVVGQDRAAYLQVGDGAIVVSAWDDDGFGWVFWPQQGEYANVTHFATDPDAPERLEFSDGPGRIDEVAMFSDGIQSLVLHYATRSVHGPFFERMLDPLRKCADAGLSAPLSAALERYLSSGDVNSRTDDDKTLILASRRAARRTPGLAGMG